MPWKGSEAAFSKLNVTRKCDFGQNERHFSASVSRRIFGVLQFLRSPRIVALARLFLCGYSPSPPKIMRPLFPYDNESLFISRFRVPANFWCCHRVLGVCFSAIKWLILGEECSCEASSPRIHLILHQTGIDHPL